MSDYCRGWQILRNSSDKNDQGGVVIAVGNVVCWVVGDGNVIERNNR